MADRIASAAALVREVADDRVQAAEKVFAVGVVLTFVVTPIGLLVASVLRWQGVF